ncbi:MAG: hypothetical protein J4F42_10675 [Desulfurellaceae bacterium]|nr:hypothetical protein [Desulfurellaceae bacterium]
MRIEIDPSAANNPDAHQQLDRIIYRIEDGWHVWDTTSLPNPDIIETTSWIRDRGSQGDWVHEMFVRSIQRDAWTSAPHGRRVRVTAHPNGTDELSPENAFRLADEPLQILVEERGSDGAFVKRVVMELDKSLHKLWRQPGEPIRFDSRGGKGKMLEHVERLMLGKPYRPRLVVIVDSDRKGPEDTESHTARALRTECEKWSVPCWVLAKREAENYLPRILLSQRKDVGADHAQLVEAWDSLTDDQKNFFDMKDGWSKNPVRLSRNCLLACRRPTERASPKDSGRMSTNAGPSGRGKLRTNCSTVDKVTLSAASR